MARELSAKEKERFIENRNCLYSQLVELQADFEDLSNEEIIEYREIIKARINCCLELVLETEEDVLGE